jgi:hypothetical protein
LDEQIQQTKLAEYQRGIEEQDEAKTFLNNLRGRMTGLMAPQVTTDAADNVTQTPGMSREQALRSVLPDMVLHQNRHIADRGAGLEKSLEATETRRETQLALLEQRRIREAQMHEIALRDAKTDEAKVAETARHNRFQEGINAQMAALSSQRLAQSKESDEFSEVKKAVSAIMLKAHKGEAITPQDQRLIDTWQRMNPTTALIRDAMGGGAGVSAAAPAPARAAPARPAGVPADAAWSPEHNAWIVTRGGKRLKWVEDK